MIGAGSTTSEISGTRAACPINGLNFAPEWAGTNVFLRSLPVADHVGELFDDELAAIEKASPLRRQTYSSGRVCARSVMADVGVEPCALVRQESGAARWPASLLGSISHTNEWAVAAVALPAMSKAASIGVDLEKIKPMEQGVIDLIATNAEREELSANRSPAWHATALFSFKESIYKCLSADFGQLIEFHDVQINDIASGRPVLHIKRAELNERCPPSQLELRMVVTSEHVFTLVWQRQDHLKAD